MEVLIDSVEGLVAAIRDDATMRGHRVTLTSDGVVEVRFGGVALHLVDARLCADPAKAEALAAQARQRSPVMVLVGAESDLAAVESVRDLQRLPLLALPVSLPRLRMTLRQQYTTILHELEARKVARYADRYAGEVGELMAITRAISSEHDIVRLLALILERIRSVTAADAGAIYILEGDEPDAASRTLRCVASQNDSAPAEACEVSYPLDAGSLAGAAALSRATVAVANLGGPDGEPYLRDRAIDPATGYRALSALAVPMTGQRGEVLAVIRLVNARCAPGAPLATADDFAREVVPFGPRRQELAETLAAQAGISLENTLLFRDIQRLFEGFVNASVSAIESRDPTTSGHSRRVATLTRTLAVVVDRADSGPYAVQRFTPDDLRQMEYAGLLHDFGKVAVREEVLVKSHKLHEHDRALLLTRFDYVRMSIENDHLRRQIDGRPTSEAELRAQLGYVDEVVAFILRANEPTVLAEGSFERLVEIAAHGYLDPDGARRPYLTDEEIEALRLTRGTLTPGERVEIERHVTHTFRFLATIPWGRAMRDIPKIAGSHHEKLDGSGYPRGLTAAEIPVESKMMCIADIYDALTAHDRPYKRAVPREAALDILAAEVRNGKCDGDLFRMFVDAKTWTSIAGM